VAGVAGRMPGCPTRLDTKVKRASDSFESLDARAALPQNCSISRLPFQAVPRNGTEVPAIATKVPALYRLFPQPSVENLSLRSGVIIVLGYQQRNNFARSLRQLEAKPAASSRNGQDSTPANSWTERHRHSISRSSKASAAGARTMSCS